MIACNHIMGRIQQLFGRAAEVAGQYGMMEDSLNVFSLV